MHSRGDAPRSDVASRDAELVADADLGRDAALRRAALAVYARYQLEFVEAYNLCPYAKPAREQGRVKEVVLTRADPRSDALDASLALAADPMVEIGLLLCPRVTLERVAWDSWVSELIAEDARRHPPGRVPFAMAAFHPHAARGAHGPESLVPYLRRTPDPTIQLVRIDALERVRKGFDEGTTFVDTSKLDLASYVPQVKVSLRARIAAANERTLVREGFEQVDALLADIRADRRRRYAELGFSGEPPEDAQT